VTFLSSPFLGPHISSSGIASSFSVFNSGDVEAWPIWTITGPGNTITLTNTTTGKALVLSITLTGGQVLTIDTRPGHKTVTREDGSNQFATVSSTSSLWELVTGNNAVTLAISETTTASGLQLQYKQRYFGV
jgi:phage-related protein